MIEFGFNEEQEMFRQEMRSFVKKELAPLAREKRIAEEFMKANKELKITTLNFPERLGGWHLDYVSVGILTEELTIGGSSLAGLAFERTFTGNDLKLLPDEVQDEIGPGLIGMWAQLRHGYTEANSGNEQAAIRTTAERQGDYYIINGEKQPATGCGGATYNIITAVTDPSKGVDGISQILVPRNLPGVTASLLNAPGEGDYVKAKGGPATPETDPRGVGACVINFDNVKVPAKYLVGKEGEGQAHLQFQHNFIAVCALALRNICVAMLTLNEIIEFSGQRVHFGQPIIQFQGVSFDIAEHYTKLEAARMLCYRALYLMDQGRCGLKDVGMAKWYGLEVAERAMLDLIRIGGYAYWSEEMPHPNRLIQMIAHSICDGQPQMQKLRILSDIAPAAITPNLVGRLTV